MKEDKLIQEILTLAKEYATTVESFISLLEGEKLDEQTKAMLRINFYQMIHAWPVDINRSKEISEKFERLLEKH